MTARNAKDHIVSVYLVTYPHIKTRGCYENFCDFSIKIVMLSK